MLLSIFFLTTVSAQSEEGVEGAFGFDDDVQDLNLYAGGSGTETYPYLIENWEHLHNVRENLDAYFLLSNDLDETSPGYTTFVKDGGTLVDSDKGWLPIGDSSAKFTGSFDGDGHTISNLIINRSNTDYVGLFGYAEGATISNLGLVGANVTGNNRIGGIVGYADNTALDNVYVTGSVEGMKSDTYTQAGGVVGYLDNSSISKSYSSADVTGEHGSLGGLVGVARYASSTIEDSYATGSVTSTGNQDYVGGLVGAIGNTTVNRTYATGLVTSSAGSNVGGLVGGYLDSEWDSSVTDSYWDIQTTGQDTSAIGGAGKTTGKMTVASTFTGWAGGAWTLAEGVTVEGYSTLRPYLTSVTRAEDKGTASTLFNSGWGGLSSTDQTGADGSAYSITTAEQLQNINLVADQGFDFELSNAIDLTGITWTPIGDDNSQFAGSFDGNSHTIANLTINQPDISEVGLFGYTNGATISNLGLLDATVTGDYNVGALVGYANDTTLNNTSASGSVTGKEYVGGLIGYAYESTIENSSTTTNVSGDTYGVGGLVGWLDDNSNISQSHATGSVTGEGEDDGNYGVGGLVGAAQGSSSISESYTTGDVSTLFASNDDALGGLVGFGYNITIDNSHATGNVTGFSGVGDWVGYGGLVGQAQADETDSSKTHLITNSYATGDVTADGANVGGLVGLSGWDSVIEQSHATGQVTGINRVGGLVGFLRNSSSVSQSFATGNTIGFSDTDDDRFHGGLIGVVENGTNTVELSYATGDVAFSTGAHTSGGLVGLLANGTVTNSYAMGDVYGRNLVTDNGAGGLIGRVASGTTVVNTFASGAVSATDSSTLLGGLIGRNQGTENITESFWNSTANSGLDGEGGVGKTTADMKTRTTFTTDLGEEAWDFENIWSIDEAGDPADNDGYPSLQWQGLDDSSPTLSLEAFEAQKLKLYPNPVKSTLHLSTTQSFEGQVEINIYSMLGQKLMALQRQATGSSLEIEVSSLNTGVYILEVISDTQNKQSIKFIKD